MKEGRVEQIGAPQEIWRRPGSRFVADFIGVENMLAGTLEGSGGDAVVRLASGPCLGRSDAGRPGSQGPVFAGDPGQGRGTARRRQRRDGIEAEVLDADYRGDSFALRLRNGLAENR